MENDFKNEGKKLNKVRIAWNKGIPMSENAKKKLSISNSGHKHTEKAKRAINIAHSGKKLSKKTKKRMSESKTGNKNPMFGKKGYLHPRCKARVICNGYVHILMPEHPNCEKKGYVSEHRFVVEKLIGRFLKKTEPVHHINNKKQDNRIENLMLFKTNSEHITFHVKLKQFGITNPVLKQIEKRWDGAIPDINRMEINMLSRKFDELLKNIRNNNDYK